MKRASMAGQSATVRGQDLLRKMRPTLRRSTSMTLRDKEHVTPGSAVEQKSAGALAQAQVDCRRPPGASNAKSHHEVDEAADGAEFRTARRRRGAPLEGTTGGAPGSTGRGSKGTGYPSQAQGSNRPLTKPTFELPGEAISRRKREERESQVAGRGGRGEESGASSRLDRCDTPLAQPRCLVRRSPAVLVKTEFGKARWRRREPKITRQSACLSGSLTHQPAPPPLPTRNHRRHADGSQWRFQQTT